MRIPSATVVFASLALSGSTFAAPTPSSPNPSSPNPNAGHSSPVLSGASDVKSPRALSQAMFVGGTRVRNARTYARKRSVSPPAGGDDKRRSNSGSKFFEGLGVPKSIKRAASNGPLHLRSASEDPTAAAMERSFTQLSTRDSNTFEAEGLGLLDPSTTGTVGKAVDNLGNSLKPLPLGDTLSGVVKSVGSIVTGTLGSKARRAESPNGTVSAEGLGILPSGAASQAQGALNNVAGAVNGLPAPVGPAVAGLVTTVGDVIVGILGKRDEDCTEDASPTKRSAVSGLPGTNGLPGSVPQQLPAGTVIAAGSQILSFPEGLTSGAPIEIIAPDVTVLNGPIRQMPGGLRNAASSAAGMAPNPTARDLSDVTSTVTGASGQAQAVAGQAQATAGQAQAIAGNAAPSAKTIIGYLPNGAPVFGSGAQVANIAATAGQLAGTGTDAAGQAGSTANGAMATAQGLPIVGDIVDGLPLGLGSIIGGLPLVGGLLSNGNGGSGASLGDTLGGIPVAGPLLGGLLGSDGPLGGLTGGLLGSTPGDAASSFGILSDPDSSPSPASASDPASTSTSTSTSTSSDPTPTAVDASSNNDESPTASPAGSPNPNSDSEGKDPTDSGDESDSDNDSAEAMDAPDAATAPTSAMPESSAVSSTTPTLPAPTA